MNKPFQQPQGWGSDKLSEFIEISRDNIFATYVNLNKFYKLLSEIDNIYRTIIDNLVNSRNWFAGFFLLRAHASFLGGARFSLSGQVSEAYMVLRGCLENSIYGIYLSNHPESQETWLKRHYNTESMSKVKNEFRIQNLFEYLKSVDVKLYDVIKILYDRTIDYGAHPNERALSSNLQRTENNNYVRFDLAYLNSDPLVLQLCLKTNAQVGVCSLDIFAHIYKKRFDILSLSDHLNSLKQNL